MKKVIYIIIGILCLTGCWTEERNYRPQKTGYANNLFRAVQDELLQTAVYLDAAKKVDLWGAAASPLEKEKIEDAYFRKYKVRQRNDTIALLAMGTGEAGALFISGGKRLTEPNAQWKIIRSFDTLKVQALAEDRWSVSLLANPRTSGQMNLTVVSGGEKGSFLLEGNGISRQGYVLTIPVAYKTEKAVAALLPLGEVNFSTIYGSKATLSDGEIVFEANKLSGTDPAKAELYSGYQYVLTYKGFTERWPINWY